MKTFEMPYPVKTVRSKKQSKAFINDILMPAADIIVNCSFKKSNLRQATREQNISFSDDPSDWAEIGFRAVRTDPIENPKLILFNIWVHNATDTSHIPLPEAVQVMGANEHEKYIGALLLDEEYEDDEVESGFENVVIEQREFFIDNGSYLPIKELQYAFACDGSVIYEESATTQFPTEWCGDSYQEQLDLMQLERSLRNEFNELDLTLIGGILGRLGLIGA